MIAVGAPSASAAPRTINVTSSITAPFFAAKTINVKAGETVSICLKTKDVPHDITMADPAFKVASGACKTLTAPAAAGSHKFVCSISGHEQLGMVGNLVVGAAGGAAAPAAAPAAGAAPQVGAVPAGGVQTGGGSTAGLTHVNLLTLGGGLLVAAMMSVLLGTRVARRN
jgi:plastocyanin